jgi:hypothetical protein
MTDCARGCLLYGLHTPDCPDTETCDGCLPRPAEIGHYCQKCAFQLRDTIDALPALIYDVRTMPGGQLAPFDKTNNGDSTRKATKVDQMSLSPALDTSDEAARWLHSWATDLADMLAERGPFQYRRDGIPEPDPLREARYLTSRLAQLCAHPVVNDITDEAKKLKHRLTRDAGTDRADQRITKVCPHCERRTLMRPNGEDYVICRNRDCAAVWQVDQLGLLAREHAAS